jgi:hypothetical protein
MKVQGPNLVRYLLKKARRLSNSRCKAMNVKVVSKDVGVGEYGAKVHVIRKYFHARLKTKLQRRYL